MRIGDEDVISMLIVVGCSYARRCAPRIAVIVVTLIYLTIIHNHNSSGFRLAHFRGQERRLTLADHSANLSVDCQLNMLHNLSLSFSVSTYLIQSLSLSISLFASLTRSFTLPPVPIYVSRFLFFLPYLFLCISLSLPVSPSLCLFLSASLSTSLSHSFALSPVPIYVCQHPSLSRPSSCLLLETMMACNGVSAPVVSV